MTFESIDTVIDFIFLIDLLVTFNTAIYHKGQLVYSRKVISLQYLKLWFWLDLISSFPFGLVTQSVEANV